MAIEIEQVHPTLRLDEAAIQLAIARACTGESVTLRELTVVLADHETVLDLNRQWLQHDFETDVLSFSLSEEDEEGVVEGEIYVDLDTAAERCAEFDASFEREALRYVVHGLLHLMGYDDTTPDEKQQMHRLEDTYLG